MQSKPFKLIPAFKDNIWGGTRLITDFGMPCQLERAAEAWVLACHKDGQSTVAEGSLAGKTLTQAIDSMGKECLGKRGQKFEFFPILIKLIDARENLSVQVHPADDYARRVEGGYGKTEMWYIVDCDEGAGLYYGFKEPLSQEEFARRISENTLLDVLNFVPVHKGECYFIPAGTVHAIGAGVLIAEIQQNSNTTYRVYDYGRVGKDGRTRELHIQKAMDVAILDRPAQYLPTDRKQVGEANCQTLADCSYFKTKQFDLQGTTSFCVDGESFAAFLAVEGSGSFTSMGQTFPFVRGDCFFIPAGCGKVEVNGRSVFLITTV